MNIWNMIRNKMMDKRIKQLEVKKNYSNLKFKMKNLKYLLIKTILPLPMYKKNTPIFKQY